MAKKTTPTESQPLIAIPLQPAPIAPSQPPPPVIMNQNQSFLDMAARRLKEMVIDAQRRRADGHITIDVVVNGGMVAGDIVYRPVWREHLARP